MEVDDEWEKMYDALTKALVKLGDSLGRKKTNVLPKISRTLFLKNPATFTKVAYEYCNGPYVLPDIDDDLELGKKSLRNKPRHGLPSPKNKFYDKLKRAVPKLEILSERLCEEDIKKRGIKTKNRNSHLVFVIEKFLIQKRASFDQVVAFMKKNARIFEVDDEFNRVVRGIKYKGSDDEEDEIEDEETDEDSSTDGEELDVAETITFDEEDDLPSVYYTHLDYDSDGKIQINDQQAEHFPEDEVEDKDIGNSSEKETRFIIHEEMLEEVCCAETQIEEILRDSQDATNSDDDDFKLDH